MLRCLFKAKTQHTVLRSEELRPIRNNSKITWYFLFFKLIYFNWRITTSQYRNGFCHTLTWIGHGCTCLPDPEPTSHLPPRRIPQGCPSALALSALFHASNLDWWSISHMVIYMFQWFSLKSSHPHLLPQSPKVCSLYLCLSCYLPMDI